MNIKEVNPGQTVKFSPLGNYEDRYSLSGVRFGDIGVVEFVDEDWGDVIVAFTRQDGVIVDGFYAEAEDLELVA
ncbi:hypothetical protein A73_180 [Escherichia phage A73]|uniref:DUF4926 domain-containing protein n=1 Tax=Escherichia phage A73 TaxID=3003819 RepID=A0AAE9W1D1_9CAUD|nr:hypothetical protein [Escherichia phage UPEC06]WBF77774.1 hypothetical protein A73_180 [Escherichia phage A73]WBF78026.1 hypothetical protein W70_165 [Escherichia phage W70]